MELLKLMVLACAILFVSAEPDEAELTDEGFGDSDIGGFDPEDFDDKRKRSVQVGNEDDGNLVVNAVKRSIAPATPQLRQRQASKLWKNKSGAVRRRKGFSVHGDRRGRGHLKPYGRSRVYGSNRGHGRVKKFGRGRAFGPRKVYGRGKQYGRNRSYGRSRSYGRKKYQSLTKNNRRGRPHGRKSFSRKAG